MPDLQFIANQKTRGPLGDKGMPHDVQTRGREGSSAVGSCADALYDTIVGGLLFKDADSVLALLAQTVALRRHFDLRGRLTWERVQARTVEYCRALIGLLFEEGIFFSCVLSQSALAPLQGRCRWWYGLYRTALVSCLDKGSTCGLYVDQAFEKHSCGSGPCKRVFIADSPCPAGKRGVFSPKKTTLHLCDLDRVIAHGLPLGVQVSSALADDNTQEHIMGLLDVLLGAVGYAACAATGNMAKVELAQLVTSKTEQLRIAYDKPDMPEKADMLQIVADPNDEVVLYDPDAPPPGNII